MFILVLAIFILSLWYLVWKANGNGPYGLPIIGYVPFLSHKPFKKLLTLSDKYGPVYPLTIWGRTYYILNSFKSVKQALNDSAIDDRPHDFNYTGDALGYSSIAGLNGAKWRAHRKFISTVMMGQTAMSQGCDVFRNVAEDLVNFIKRTEGRPTDYREPVSKTTTNAITSVLYSKRYDWEDEELSYITDKIRYFFRKLHGLEFVFAGRMFELYMKTVNRGRHQSLSEAFQECTALFERMVEKRLKDGDYGLKRDLYDHFLSNHVQEVEDNVPEKDRLFTVKALAFTTVNLVLAAADTSSETIYWALYFLAKYPLAQKKVQQELEDVIGSRAVAMADRGFLPHTLAFIEETQRVACLLPTGVTRQAAKDTEVCGIKVPKGSYVLPNIYACLTDETYFKNPDVFDPSRFVNDEGKFVSIEANCQFTLGKRSCVGETFARVELLTILCTVLQNFNLTFPSDQYQVDFTDGAYRVLHPYQLCMKERA
ncbi:Cytochrome P450 2A9 [Halotydeus destructor]|nr:Cytochrome P450 2A9 [Halotydeus destructor]